MSDADVVLEGGGVKGIALVGAIEVLEEEGYTIHRVAGTSAGSIVGALLASGMTGPEMVTMMRGVDYKKFQDEGPEEKIPLIGKVFSVLHEKGIYEGKYIRSWVAGMLEKQDVRTFSDMRIDDPGSTLPPEQSFRLVVMVSDVTTGRLRRFPWDYRALGHDPGTMSVADAVRASASIPFFFEPVTLKNKKTKEDLLLVDGGMLSNFPVEVFDRTDGKPPRWPTFGIKLSMRRGEQATKFKVKSTVDFGKAMIGTMTSFHDQMHIDDPAVAARTIFVDTAGIKATKFDLTKDEADMLYKSGRNAATGFLRTWDFDKYIEQYRSDAITLPQSRLAEASKRVAPR